VTGFPCLGLLRGLRQHDGHRGHSLGIPSCLPSFICWTSRTLGRLPVAVLVLASRKSMPMPWLGCVLSMAPRRCPTFAPAFGCRRHTSPAASSAFRLLSRVGEGDISALGCGLTGSCSSTFQCYSLGNHLGVTASPQSPLPAGYVTLPVDGRSPPLGLMPSHSRGQGFFSFPSFLISIPAICTPDHPGRGAQYVMSLVRDRSLLTRIQRRRSSGQTEGQP
jgi:hypothetical protein